MYSGVNAAFVNLRGGDDDNINAVGSAVITGALFKSTGMHLCIFPFLRLPRPAKWCFSRICVSGNASGRGSWCSAMSHA
jgi:hypothetical protein